MAQEEAGQPVLQIEVKGINVFPAIQQQPLPSLSCITTSARSGESMLLMRTKLTAVRVRKKVSFPSSRKSSMIGIEMLTDGLSLSSATGNSILLKSLEAESINA